MLSQLDEILAYLDAAEPDYPEIVRQLAPEGWRHLEALLDGEDPLRASKAAYLAGLLQPPESVRLLKKASQSAQEVVRIAAAGGAYNLPSSEASEILRSLLRDESPSVRKTALESLKPDVDPALLPVVESIRDSDSEPFVREVAKQTREEIGDSVD